jgi:hypothetical protein
MAKKIKPMRTKLLKIVRAGIVLKKVDIHNMPMFEIENSISKSQSPRHTLIATSLNTAKMIVNVYRLETAKLLAPHKKDAKNKKEIELPQSNIIIV